MKILVTGAAGFIGYHLCERLIKLGHTVIGLDNINNYYDIRLKYARLGELGIVEDKISPSTLIPSVKHGTQFQFVLLNLEDRKALDNLFDDEKFNMVVNLAAQAGVRYSLENPVAYVDSNIVGFLNILECCRHHAVPKLIYASSSSIYGNNGSVPYSVEEKVDAPISLYAATKKSNELMAHTYSHLFGIETIGLRFFTVYGPWGRPDMAMFLFTDAILNHKPIHVFNQGNLSRDFTYIDDIIDGVVATIITPTLPNIPLYRIYNIGNNSPVKLLDFIIEIERVTGKKAEKIMMPMQPGDVAITWADVSQLKSDYGYSPKVTVAQGIAKFVKWFKEYYNIDKTEN